jgi:hypothetical protein
MSAQIPSTSGIDPLIRRVLDPIKENMETLKGRRGTKIQALPATASTTEIIDKINSIIAKLQD